MKEYNVILFFEGKYSQTVTADSELEADYMVIRELRDYELQAPGMLDIDIEAGETEEV